MRRILVVGQSGSGKSTLARALSQRLGIAHIELDALFHGPRWTTSATFVQDVTAAISGDSWVVDGNYSAVRDLLWSRADTVVWLDLPRTTVLRRVLWRTSRRLVSRRELWNGNREQLSTVLRASHPIRWTWETHAPHRAANEQRFADPAWSHLTAVRLRTPVEVTRWIARQ